MWVFKLPCVAMMDEFAYARHAKLQQTHAHTFCENVLPHSVHGKRSSLLWVRRWVIMLPCGVMQKIRNMT